jgi:predicted anti-sigma-YlaC factor YlaD
MKHIDHLLSAYIDQELSEHQRKEVERHLQVCPHCMKMYEDLVSISHQLVTAYENLSLPDHLTDKVMAAIYEKEAEYQAETFPPLLSYTTLRWGALSSIFLLLFLNGIIIFVVGTIFSFTPISILLHLLYGLLTVIMAIPYFIAVMCVVSIILIGISLLLLRRLLNGKRVEFV